jgi:hypothetical protein
MNQLWVFGIFVAVLIGVAVISVVAAAKRRRALEELARRFGFTFEADAYDGDTAAARYAGFDPFGRGRSRRASNLLRGRRAEIEFELFDYRFTTGSGKNKKTHRYGIVAAHVPMRFTSMRIRPEGVFDKLVAFAGFDDINFESHEFSARYHVSCDDRQFAYHLIHAQAIEHLLRCPPLHWQLGGGVIVLHRSGAFKPDELPRAVEAVEGFMKTIPAFVREDVARRGINATG